MNGKQMIALVGSGLLLAASWSYAQEQQDQAVPPQQVADGGVEAVRDAQEGAPVPVEKFEGAGKVLRKQAKSRKWREGWDDKKKRIIVIEEAEFKTKDPATDESFFIKREMAAKKAVLKAKVSIIQTINHDDGLRWRKGCGIHEECTAGRLRLDFDGRPDAYHGWLRGDEAYS